MEAILRSDLDKAVKLGEIEVFTAEQLKNFVVVSNDTIEKSVEGKADMMAEVAATVRSFKPFLVWDDDTLEKSIQFVRPV
jgi:hypothetical protein